MHMREKMQNTGRVHSPAPNRPVTMVKNITGQGMVVHFNPSTWRQRLKEI